MKKKLNILAIGGPSPFREIQNHLIQQQKQYDDLKNQVIFLSGSDSLVKIIEAESGDYDRRIAFLSTTLEALAAGEDYSGCKTIDDMAKIYSSWMIRRCFNG